MTKMISLFLSATNFVHLLLFCPQINKNKSFLFTLSNKYISSLVIILIVLFMPISLFFCRHSLDFMIKSIKIQYTIAIKVIRFYDQETLSFSASLIRSTPCVLFLLFLKRSIQFTKRSLCFCTKSFRFVFLSVVHSHSSSCCGT